MVGRSKLALGAIGLGALIVSTGIAVAAGGSGSPPVTRSASTNLSQIRFAQVKRGTLGGLVAAGKIPGKPTVSVYVSLHGVPPIQGRSDRYLVTVDRRPCSRVAGDFNQDGDVDGADFLVFRVGVIMANTEGDFHVRAPLQAALGSAQSVRIYDNPGPLVQKACGPTVG